MSIPEEMLWSYIDEDCSQQERSRVDAALLEDALVRENYKRLLEFHERFLKLFAASTVKAQSTEPTVGLVPRTAHIDAYSETRSN